MTIQLLVSVAGDGFSYSAGRVVADAPLERCKDLIRAGHAVEVAATPAAKRETAVPKLKKETR